MMSFSFNKLLILSTLSYSWLVNASQGFLEEKNLNKTANLPIRETLQERLTSLALEGDMNAQFKLGMLLMNGEKEDCLKGVEWLEIAAEQGQVEAQLTLGKMYQIGLKVERNSLTSLYWISQAALQGNEKAIQSLKNLFSTFQELYSIHLPKEERNYWKIDNHQVSIDEYIIESVPLNETVTHWSQIFTISFMSKKILNRDFKTALSSMNAVRELMRKNYGGKAKLTPIQVTDNDVIYETFIPLNKTNQFENEIVRLIRTPRGLYRIAYSRKNSCIDDKTKHKWLKSLCEADLIKLK
ncbi:hypothetical protein DB44_BC00110 [Candidatus Protochlamydia amoebophila]|uniref:Sel1 repeat family protein n=2 Tax=Candidatus Protochlamydia amoebophila TaxID=362787 RepID=A0A0C1HG09_9BACT|nr:hypothetical protein DB44_BC00110 [Candidatus Protochlamydia amoebophila]